MKVSTGLSLAAAGAIFAFAVHAHLGFLNFTAAGWVIMLVGIAGLVMPSGTQRWLRQRLILRDGKLGPTIEETETVYNRTLMPGGVLVDDPQDLPVQGSAIEEQIVQE
jgi:hypothetical protein